MIDIIKDILFFRPTAPVPTIPGGLDSQTSIRINDETFLIEADDLESQCVLGRGAYGVVEKVKHKQTGTILAVKVRIFTLNKKDLLKIGSFYKNRPFFNLFDFFTENHCKCKQCRD